MNNYTKHFISFFALLGSFIGASADNCCNNDITSPQHIAIINDTENQLQVSFAMPEQTVADIKIKNLNLLQDALHAAIVANSA